MVPTLSYSSLEYEEKVYEQVYHLFLFGFDHACRVYGAGARGRRNTDRTCRKPVNRHHSFRVCPICTLIYGGDDVLYPYQRRIFEWTIHPR